MSLSILIPSREEKHLKDTIMDIFVHSEAETEVIVGIDGGTMRGLSGLIQQFPKRLTFLRKGRSIGQRAMTNELARMSDREFVMKVDAHCSFSQGFDRVLLESIDDRTILAPYLLILDGETWTVKGKPASSSYYFDRDFVFQYNTKAENLEPFVETMCLQGSAWMISRENYWKWNVCDETYGSWGSQGVELGISAWMNGGRCATDKGAYYGHLFRETDEDFPYKRDKTQMRHAHNEIKSRYEGRVDGLVKKFGSPGNWTI